MRLFDWLARPRPRTTSRPCTRRVRCTVEELQPRLAPSTVALTPNPQATTGTTTVLTTTLVTALPPTATATPPMN